MDAAGYQRLTVNAPNPLARFAHRSRARHSLAMVMDAAPISGSVVDFGPGDGYLLYRLGEARPDLRLVGVEDEMSPGFPGVVYMRDFSAISEQSLDVVSAFETLEHLSDSEISTFCAQVRRTLRPTGRLTVSVPIMCGAALPLKTVNRAVFHRQWPDHSLLELARGIAGLAVERPANLRITHKGFDFRRLVDQLRVEGFVVLFSFYSPFKWMPWWLSSQVFLVLYRAADSPGLPQRASRV